ncbi:uncharacterized protein EAE97_008109 [Botrytis byssoidea]|uniref:Uncharacterized protein n=1 Tax=Botrytis byssoidea TaxID=139641 RepID=A0A9P5IDG5_9HELO|nr:uncharacterized protein EAE97_008109 [Botrytis byssoidea]KAF7935202.1 hypothetical protein EAE97_008109 [Botrytis byssoidea]
MHCVAETETLEDQHESSGDVSGLYQIIYQLTVKGLENEMSSDDTGKQPCSDDIPMEYTNHIPAIAKLRISLYQFLI